MDFIVHQDWGVELANTNRAFFWKGDFDEAARLFAMAMKRGEKGLLEDGHNIFLDWDPDEMLDLLQTADVMTLNGAQEVLIASTVDCDNLLEAIVFAGTRLLAML